MAPAKEPSLEPPEDAVKEPKVLSDPGSEPAAGGPRFGRLFEGWELGATTVGLVLSTALLAVPRAATPGVIPVPLLDPAEAQQGREQTRELATRAEREGLPFETRAVGDAVRRLGVALSGGDGDAEHLQRLILERVQLALGADQADALLRLRAVQARLFVRAVRAQAWDGPVTPELAALGGDFASRARRNGWADAGGCRASDDELETLFLRRWVDVTHLREHPRFKSTLGELRRYYRFLLLHPERLGQGAEGAAERAAVRLRYVEALAKRDTEYPLELARGSLLGALGDTPRSAQALSSYLSRASGAQFNLRARNYLIFAATSQSGEPGADEP
jgi:hypothetical protein